MLCPSYDDTVLENIKLQPYKKNSSMERKIVFFYVDY